MRRMETLELTFLMQKSAVMNREIGKPCIIGTKMATKVLKDGDLVEADANK